MTFALVFLFLMMMWVVADSYRQKHTCGYCGKLHGHESHCPWKIVEDDD